MHKVLVVANNQKWKSWDDKIQELHDWFKGIIKVDLIHTKFRNVPFVQFDTNKYEIDRAWYDTNIHPLCTGYDIVLLSLPTREWKGKGITGRWTHDSLIEEIQIGANETGTYYFGNKKFPGGRWFNLARHEISHALYKIFKAYDKTHFWWETGSFESSRDELLMLYNKSMEIKPTWNYPNFKPSEFKHLDKIKEFAIKALQSIRTKYGKPMVITSDWREEGSHSSGCDFDVKSEGKEFYKWIYSQYKPGMGGMFWNKMAEINSKFQNDEQYKLAMYAISCGATRIGVYDKHLHIGFDSPNPQRVVWAGVSK